MNTYMSCQQQDESRSVKCVSRLGTGPNHDMNIRYYLKTWGPSKITLRNKLRGNDSWRMLLCSSELLFSSLSFKIVNIDIPSFCKCLNQTKPNHTFGLQIT